MCLHRNPPKTKNVSSTKIILPLPSEAKDFNNFFPQICSKNVSRNLTLNRWLSTSNAPLFFTFFLIYEPHGKSNFHCIMNRSSHPHCIFSGSTKSWALMDVCCTWGGRRVCSNWNKIPSQNLCQSFSFISDSGNQIECVRNLQRLQIRFVPLIETF